MGVARLLAHLVDSQQQRRLAQLVLVQAVFQMTQRRDGKDKLLLGVLLNNLGKVLKGLFCRQELPFKLVGGQLMAVRDHPTALLMTKDPRGAQTDDNPFRL